MVTTTSTEVEEVKSQVKHAQSTSSGNQKLVALAACVLWVSTWLVLPLVTTSFVGIRFGWIWACAWWLAVGVLPPSLPPSPQVREFFQQMLGWVESSRIIGKMDNTSSKPVLYCHHPHGIVCISAVVHGSKPHGVRAIVAPAVFKIPFCRQLMEFMGSIPADKDSMKKALMTKKDLAIVPGGVEEVALCSRDAERAYLLNRKGFIKYAMQFGYDLQPCYHFGETQQYSIFWPFDTPFMLRLRIWIANKTQVAIGAGLGDWMIPLIPRRSTRCITVVGDKISVPLCQSPTEEQVNSLHQAYIDQVVQLYNAHRHLLPEYRDKDLELW